MRSVTGWGEVSAHYSYFIRWANGRKEELPSDMRNISHFLPMESVRVAETSDAVFLLAECGLVARKGPKSTPLGEWYVWQIEPSDDLFAYMLSLAQATSPKDISIDTYDSEPKPGRLIRYRGTSYFLAETFDRRCWLPYRLASVDTVSHETVFKIAQAVPAMPDTLVFRGSVDLARFSFGRQRSEAALREAGSDETVQPSVVIAPWQQRPPVAELRQRLSDKAGMQDNRRFLAEWRRSREKAHQGVRFSGKGSTRACRCNVLQGGGDRELDSGNR
jgi:hypothetical protein